MSARTQRAQLHRLAALHGIEHRYRDASGVWRTVSPESILAVLRALGVAVSGMSDVPDALAASHVARDAEFTPKQVETRAERVNLVYATKVDLEGGWDVPLVPGQPAEVVIRTP